MIRHPLSLYLLYRQRLPPTRSVFRDPFCFPGSVLLFGIRPSFRNPALRFIRVLRLRRGVHLLSGRQEF